MFRDYQVTDVPRDNNCLFSAIADQLKQDDKQGHILTSALVRQQLVDYLKQHHERYSEFFSDSSVFCQPTCVSQNESFEEYIKRMGADKTWGDGTMLSVAAVKYNRPVVVIYVDESNKQQKIIIDKNSEGTSSTSRNPICLGLIATPNETNNHYVSLSLESYNPERQDETVVTTMLDSTATDSSGQENLTSEVRMTQAQFLVVYTVWCIKYVQLLFYKIYLKFCPVRNSEYVLHLTLPDFNTLVGW